MVFTITGGLSNPNFGNRFVYLALLFTCGCLTFIFNVTQRYSFGFGGENLTATIRRKLFSSFLSKHLGWFDQKDKAPGILTNMIAEDISKLNGLTTETISIFSEVVLGISLSVGICIAFEWKLGLICLVLAPFLALGAMVSSFMAVKNKKKDEKFN
jgi:ATP-binding cassette subfamily B (MDR/TAP) protein 1